MASDDQRWRQLWWQQADQFRGWPEERTPLALIRGASDRGLISDWRELAAFARVNASDFIDPQVVADFALAFTADEPPKRVLDPWAGLGVTLTALEAGDRLESGVAIEINAAVFELARELSQSQRIDWRLGDAADMLSDDVGSFDLVIGSPPLGLPRALFETRRPEVRLTSSKTYTMLVQAALTLRPAGALVAVLPESFFAAHNGAVREALAAASVYPSAALALPLRVFSTSVPLSLVVLTNDHHDYLFAAELDPSTDFAAIVANLRARREGRLTQLGHLVPAHRFASWRATVREVEITEAARMMGLRTVPFADLCIAIHAPPRHGVAFDAEPNAVYVPKLGTSPAVTSLDALAIKPHNYLQLIVRPEVVDPEYLAAFLSSPLGRKVREQVASGTTIPQISLTTLRTGSALLPPQVEHQRSAVRVGRKLGELRQSVAGLERRLWEQPLKASRIEADLRQLLEGDGMERWIEALPFPLASILWRYQAEENAEQRCKYLVHFFEGTAVFLVDLHVSALHRDPHVLAEVARRGKIEASYTRGSIGIWADLLSRLAKRTRDLSSKDSALAKELFRLGELERLEAITRKSLVVALKNEAAAYRNNWFGHPAVVGLAEWERRLSQAEATLARVRTGLGDAFVGWELVRTGRGGNRAGVITTSVERLVGSRSLFRKGSVGLREWPEEGGLYMLEEGSSLPLRLSPLFRLQRSPESVEDACYFYDRIEDGGVRWVSYHYEPQPEVVHPNTEVVQLIEELNALG